MPPISTSGAPSGAVPMMMPGLGMVDATTKPLRELFIGNIPEGTQPDMLHEFLAVAMREVGMIAADAPDPILTVRVNPKFAFAEFRSVDEATRALDMDGIPFLGQGLRMRRPEKYPGPAIPHRTWVDVIAAHAGGGGGGAHRAADQRADDRRAEGGRRLP